MREPEHNQVVQHLPMSIQLKDVEQKFHRDFGEILRSHMKPLKYADQGTRLRRAAACNCSAFLRCRGDTVLACCAQRSRGQLMEVAKLAEAGLLPCLHGTARPWPQAPGR